MVIDPAHGEIYCADCGLIIEEDVVDSGPEWRAFDTEQKTKRVRTGPGMSYRMHDKGLGTSKPKLPAGVCKLPWINWGSKTLVFALTEIERQASMLKLPADIREETALLYRKAAKQNLIKGRSIEELVSAMLYIVCRQYGLPRTLKEIAKVSRSSLKKIRRAYLALMRELGLKLAPVEPSQYVPRLCSELGLSEATREKAIEILKRNKDAIASKGWTPIGTAAAAIYIVTTLNKEVYCSEKEIAKVAGTTEVTIRNRSREILASSN